jgi:hypothetical protein
VAAAGAEMSWARSMKSKAAIAVGLLVGLVVKYSMLFYIGVFDMPAYFEWGRSSLESGLIKAYHGIYFPLQYQLFEVYVWLTSRLGYEYFIVFKASNLVFDIATFLVLVALLKREGLSPAYSLLYWLHPWFLSMFALGYIDFQFTFFVLLSVWAMRDESANSWTLAGIPLGLAFVMKPQSMILIVAAFFYCVFRFIRTRDYRPVGLLAGPVVAFTVYETFFTLSLYEQGRRVALKVLPMSYLDITNVFPCLNAQMTNIWYPIAHFMKKPDQPIFSVSDKILIAPHVPAKFLAGIVVIGLVALSVFLVERKAAATVSSRFVEIWGIATMTVPMFMTSAHENHFFLGSVFLVLLVARSYPLIMKVAAHILLMIQFVNLYGLYGVHPERIARFLTSHYSEGLAVAYSVIAVLCFVIILGTSLRNWKARA